MLRGTVRLGAATIGVAAAAWVVAVTAVYAYGRRDHARRADAIVVLGAAQYDGRPSPVLQARLDHAVRLYEQGVASTLIMTGGTGPGDTVSEAVVSRRYATRAGVPESAILTERAGERSVQSIEAVARLMDARGLRSAVLVSDPFHMLRLRLLAAKHGLRAYPSPTRSSPISANPEEEWRHTLRESIGLPFAVLEDAEEIVGAGENLLPLP